MNYAKLLPDRDALLRLNPGLVARLLGSTKIGDLRHNKCWVRQNRKGRYSQIEIRIHCGRKLVYAHRLAYILDKGLAKAGPIEIAHLCDNPRCINPSHLRQSTRKENLKEAAVQRRINASVPNGVLGQMVVGHRRIWDGWGLPEYNRIADEVALALRNYQLREANIAPEPQSGLMRRPAALGR
jgi:hypothetical protein